MDKDMERLGKERLKRVRRRRQLATFIISMAVVVLSITVYRLIQPASAEDQNQYTFEIDGEQTAYINLSGLKTQPQIEVNGTDLPVKWDGSEFKMNAHLTFSISEDEYTILDGKRLNYYYSYGPDVHIPDSLMKDWYTDQEKNAFDYHFVKDSAGNYAVVLKFHENYLADNPKLSEGYIDFDCTVSGKTDESGDVVVKVGGDATLTIEPDLIDWNKDTSLNYDIDVKKNNTNSGQLATDEQGRKYAEYTVDISTNKGTPDFIDLNDVFSGNGMTVDTDNITYSVVKGNTEVTGQCEFNFTQDTENKKWNMSAKLPKLEAGETYKLTYRYYISTDMLKNGEYKTSNNKVEVKSEDKKTNEKVIDTSSSSVSYTKELIDKTGELSSDKTKIKWTITVNKCRDSISGYTLTDNMLDKAENLKITSEQSNADKGYDIVKDSNGKIQKIVFKDIDGQKNDCAYVITYETTVERQSAKYTVENKADIYKDIPGENTTTGKTDVPGTLNDRNLISKKYVSNVKDETNQEYILKWTSTINIPVGTIKAGASYEDALKNTANAPEFHYMTYEQAEAFINQFKTIYGDYVGNFKVRINYNFVDWDTVNKNNNPQIQSVSFEFVKDYTNNSGEVETHIFNYETTGKYPEQGGYTYGNVIHFGDCWAKDEFVSDKEPVKSKIIKTDINNQTGKTQITGNADGTVTWKVQVVLNKSANEYVITDNLPDGVQIQNLKVALESSYNNGFTVSNIDGTEYKTDTSNSDDKTAGIKVKAEKKDSNTIITTVKKNSDTCKGWYEGSSIYVVYTCKIDGYDSAQAGDKFEFTNHASAKSDTSGDIGKAEQTQVITKPSSDSGKSDNPEHGTEVLQKTGVWTKGTRTLSYTVTINPEGKDLVEDCDTLDLIDKLKYDENMYYTDSNSNKWIVVLNPTKVKLYEGIVKDDGTVSQGDEIKDWSYTYEEVIENQYNPKDKTKIIKAKVPDGKPLLLKYVYNVNTLNDVPDNLGWEPHFNVTNDVSLSGVSHKSTQDNTEVTYSNAHTSAGITKANSYVLYKVEKGNFSKTLAGAEFELYKYDPDSTDSSKTSDGYVPVQKYVADKDGRIVIEFDKSVFDFNRQYYLIETKAPDGYVLPDNPDKWMFYYESSNTNKYPVIAPNGTLGGRKPSDGYLQDFVEDDKVETTSIDITKKWKDSQGNVIDKKDGKIYLEVHQVGSDGTDKTYKDSIEVVPDSNGYWSYSIDNLPLYATDDSGHLTGVTYKYYIKETGVDEQHTMNGYIASYVYTNQDGQVTEYSNNVVPSKDSAMTSGKVDITNTLNTYELPETGGSGNRWLYMLSGFALMIIAAITLFYKKTKNI